MKLHIGNLSPDTTEAELKELIAPIGAATTVEIVRSKEGVSRGYGFAEFASDDDARAVITGMDGKTVGGNALKVAEARSRKNEAPRT
jgi:small subunit ribosomal protein S19